MKKYYESATKALIGFFAKSFCLLFLLLLNLNSFAQNNIVNENALTGNPSSQWDIVGAGDLSIQGFATDISVNKGQTVHFKIKTNASAYTINIYRIGYYQGNGARLQGSGVVTATLPETQPSDLYDVATGKTDCSNWTESAHWDIPSTAVSGIYIAKLTRTDNGGASHIVFIVRDDLSTSNLLFKTSDATWQAYNNYGGNSFYVNGSGTPVPGFNHATKISYDRPFYTRSGGGGGAEEDWFMNAEYPMIRWLERNGYDMSYVTDVDMERDLSAITPLNHKVILSVGHDEYWSAAMRSKVENARNAGVHLAFFSGNEVYWKTRWENNTRTLVCYKEGTLGENVCNAKCDPLANTWTGLWRDGCSGVYGSNDGCLPENALSGQISWEGSTTAIEVPDTYKNLRFWRNTSVATLGSGQTATLSAATLGYEWDWEQAAYSDKYPKGRITLSSTTSNGRTHKLSLYRHSSGALVFGAGTVQWSWGLDGNHDRGTSVEDLRMQQATVNLFADMGVQPSTPHAGLVAATASTDFNAPVSIIAAPVHMANITAGTSTLISGTCSDAAGIIAGIEVSVDGGLSWQLASGTTNWNYSWTPSSVGTIIIKVRGYDDSGNMEVPGSNGSSNNITVNIITAPCPCKLFQSSDVPVVPITNDAQAIELGMKFRTTQNGFITGIRYYRGAGTTGTQTGHLWSSTGTLLASAIFAGTPSGWQEVLFAAPVAVTSGTTYVASYFSTSGDYAVTNPYFTTAKINGPLRGLANGEDGANGVYIYSNTSAFPTNNFQSSNYWVDVVFDDDTSTIVTPPANTGPGGPILVIGSAANPFSRYAAEILNAEGMNAYTAMDVSLVTPSILNNYDVIILGEISLSAAMVSNLSNWTNAGGTLITFKPDAQLYALLGITAAAGTLNDKYLLVNTSNSAGAGIVNQSIQFHGSANLFTLNGASSLGTLYSDAGTATVYPAISINNVGSNGGQAIAFAYDLAKSIVYTRQGNPAWAGDERDGQSGPIRANDMFFGNKAGDAQTDWIDLNKVAIPQADEQQRLLVNIILQGNLDHKPLPRFWYLPKGLKAAVVMTGDDHGNGGTIARFNQYKNLSTSNAPAAVTNWTAIRGTSYIYSNTPITNTQITDFQNDGFEIGLHLNTGCANFTESSLLNDWSTQTAAITSNFPGMAAQKSNRTHCIAWSDWATQAKIQAARGIRLDVNYYYWPGSWVQDRPGMFTGSGIPMRFADTDGSLIDCYQVATQLTDESGMTMTSHINTLLDNAIGSNGYYGVFCANMHTDANTSSGSDDIINSAIARNIPVVSAKQMLDWIDGRNNSSFNTIEWNNNQLSFNISASAGSNNMKGMVPLNSSNGTVDAITYNSTPVTFTTETIKGIAYAFFDATLGNGTYVINYNTTPPPPVSTPCFTDATDADFSTGTVDANTLVSLNEEGSVILKPLLNEEFSSLPLTTSWNSFAWTGGISTVSSGILSVSGSRYNTQPASTTYGPGTSIEFMATFGAASFQHIGFGGGTDAIGSGGIYNGEEPWAMFSTGNTSNSLRARTYINGSTFNDFIISTPGLIGAAHKYRINWKADGTFEYFIDDVLVRAEPMVINSQMRPAISDYNNDATPVMVDWFRILPYTASGTFLSRVYDAGATKNWEALSASMELPAGTSIVISVRKGDNPVPNGSWTSFAQVTSGNNVGGSSRYIQYKADLSSSNANSTPVLKDISINCSVMSILTAGFTSAVTTGTCADRIQFTNTTVGSGFNSLWDFGDGSISTQSNPLKAYTTSGTYLVTLTVSNGTETSSVSASINAVAVSMGPVAGFSINSNPQPLYSNRFNFNNTSSHPGFGWITSYAWDFGDGTTNHVNTFVYDKTYAAAGTYYVSLTAVSSQGCTDVATHTVSITPSAVASFTASSNNCSSREISFSNTSVLNTSNLWNFGDGSPESTLENPSHTYATDGTYFVTLTINGNLSVIKKVICATTPLAGPITSTISSCSTYTFSNNALGVNLTYAWTFAGGTGTPSTASTASRSYSSASATTVDLTITADGRCSVNTAQLSFVPEIASGSGPNASYAYTSTTGSCANRIQFNNTTPGSGLTYLWDFGDGTTSTQANPLKAYASSGNYTVTLTANNGSCSGTSSASITALAVNDGPVAGFIPNYITQNLSGNKFNFFNTTQHIGYGWVTNYTWDFGDGTSSTNTFIYDKTYASAGTYTVVLTAVSSTGCIDIATQNIIVTPSLSAAFTSTLNSCSNRTVSFTNTSALAINYSWNFGDGSATSSIANPEHLYAADGNYTVTLTINGSMSVSHQVVVATTPVVTAIVSTLSSCGNMYQFSNASSGMNLSYAWNFSSGTGPLSNSSTANRYYASETSTTVDLVVTADGRCAASATQLIFTPLTGSGPTISFSMEEVHTGVCNTGIIFTSTGDAGSSYTWNFGDGTVSSNSATSSLMHTYPATGTYMATLTLNLAGGCSSTSEPAAVVVNYTGYPVPETGFTTLNAAQCITGNRYDFFNTTQLNGWGWVTTYNWDFGDGTSDPVNTFTYGKTYASPGTYEVTLTATTNFGCTRSSSMMVTILATPCAPSTLTPPVNNAYNGKNEVNANENTALFLGIAQQDISSKIGLYPNPNTGNFNLGFTDLQVQNGVIFIMDMLGREVYATNINMKDKTEFEFTDLNLPEGTYNLLLTTENNLTARKPFVVIK